MYQAGEKVVYGIHGVCLVADRETQTVDRKQVTYLVLEPVGQTGARFLVPAHNAAAMAKVHRLLTKEELEALVASGEVRADAWIQDENRRKQTYRELIGSGDRVRLMCMIRTLYRHREARRAEGRKCHISDENILRDAERLVSGEISVVLGYDQAQTKAYLKERLIDA